MKGVTQLPPINDLIVAKTIYHPDPDNPLEIVYELKEGLGFDTTDGSLAVADILRSEAHYHQIIKESYLVIGQNGLRLHVDGMIHDLKPGDSLTIPPLTHHWAEGLNGQWARVLVSSSPPWTKDDHRLC